jgi:hypothetical protein
VKGSKAKAMKRYHISKSNKLIYMQLSGDISSGDFIKFLREVSLDEEYSRAFNSLIDLQQVTSMFSAQEAKEIIECAALIRNQHEAKSAIITNSMFKKILVDTAGWLSNNKALEVKGFTDCVEACRWLQLENKDCTPDRFTVAT